MKEFKRSHLLSSALFLYFLIPYLIFLSFYNFTFAVRPGELLWAFKNSLTQSLLTAFITMLLSIPMSQGLFLLPGKLQNLFNRLLIIPQILPAIFSILIAFAVVNPFPMGSTGVVLLFVMINLGFATLLTYSATHEKLGMLPIVSEVYSLGRFNFFRKVYFPLIRDDLIAGFFMIFIFCLSSFSIPLIVGGGKGTNIEVLIYEKIFVEQNWPAAFGLCLFQAVLIGSLSFLLLKNKKRDHEIMFSSGSYLKSYAGLIIIAVYLSVYIGGYVAGLVQSLSQIDFIMQFKTELLAELFSVTLFTTKALFYYLLLNLVLLILWLLDYLENLKFNLAINLISVSTLLVGFALYLALPLTRDFDIIKIIFAMSVLFFPSLFKLFLQQPIENLRQQLVISQMYGLKKTTIIVEIILKQIPRPLYLWLSLLVVWFISEYAILKALGVQTQTLGLFSEGFLSSYRMSISYLMSLYILIYWLIAMIMVYLILKVSYVVYKKFIF